MCNHSGIHDSDDRAREISEPSVRQWFFMENRSQLVTVPEGSFRIVAGNPQLLPYCRTRSCGLQRLSRMLERPARTIPSLGTPPMIRRIVIFGTGCGLSATAIAQQTWTDEVLDLLAYLLSRGDQGQEMFRK